MPGTELHVDVDGFVLAEKSKGGHDDAHEGRHRGARARRLNDVVHETVAAARRPRGDAEEDGADECGNDADIRAHAEFENDIGIRAGNDRRYEKCSDYRLPGQFANLAVLRGILGLIHGGADNTPPLRISIKSRI